MLNCTTGIPSKTELKFLFRKWQRNYWEHIIRDERAYFMIREYIQNNPTKWEMDCFHGSTNENELQEPSAEYHTDISHHDESYTVNEWFEIR